jgi:predicted PurR-regulated permease PerM
VLHIDESELRAYLARALSFAQGTSGELLGASLSLLGGTLLTVAGFSILLSEGDAALSFLYSVSPLSRGQTEELFGEFRSVSSAAVLGTTATALVQGSLALIAYLIAGVPHAIFLGVATLVASFIPVIGTSIIWVPVCAVLAFQARVPWAIFVAVWCGVLVVLSDNVIKPLVMKNGVEMHTALIFLSLLGGIAAFGLIGIIIGPLAVSLLLAILRMYRRDYAPASAPPPVKTIDRA